METPKQRETNTVKLEEFEAPQLQKTLNTAQLPVRLT